MDTTALFSQAVDKLIFQDNDGINIEFLNSLKTIAANPKAVSFILDNPVKVEAVMQLLLPPKNDRTSNTTNASEYTSGSRMGFNICRNAVLNNLDILKGIIQSVKELNQDSDDNLQLFDIPSISTIASIEDIAASMKLSA